MVWIERTPDSAAMSRFQLGSTPLASGVTRPRPVTTTRRMRAADDAVGRRRRPTRNSIGLVLLDEGDGVLHRQNLLGRVVRNLASELLFEGHN